MSLTHREDSITGIRLRDAQRTKIAISATMANGSVSLELPEGGVCTGTTVKFKAPCTCENVTGGILIGGTKYTVVDANKNCLTGIGSTWQKGAEIVIVLDCDENLAYLQNATAGSLKTDLDGLRKNLNDHIGDKHNPHEVHATQVPISDECARMTGATSWPVVDEALKMLYLFLESINKRFTGTTRYSWRTFTVKTVVTKTVTLQNLEYDHIGNAKLTFLVSNSITAGTDGSIQLVSPTQATIKEKQNVTEISQYGRYIMEVGGNTVYEITDSTKARTQPWTEEIFGTGDTLYFGPVNVISAFRSYAGTIESDNANAYPDGEWQNGVYYSKNNIETAIPNYASGSYTGTNLYGSSDANELLFPFVPEMVVIQGASTGKTVTLLHGCTGVDGLVVTWNDSKKSVSWYHASSASNQLNQNTEYRYFAVGKGVYA